MAMFFPQLLSTSNWCVTDRVYITLSQYAWTYFEICLCTDFKWIDDFLTFPLPYYGISIRFGVMPVYVCVCVWQWLKHSGRNRFHSVCACVCVCLVCERLRGFNSCSHWSAVCIRHERATSLNTAIRIVCSICTLKRRPVEYIIDC